MGQNHALGYGRCRGVQGCKMTSIPLHRLPLLQVTIRRDRGGEKAAFTWPLLPLACRQLKTVSCTLASAAYFSTAWSKELSSVAGGYTSLTSPVDWAQKGTCNTPWPVGFICPIAAIPPSNRTTMVLQRLGMSTQQRKIHGWPGPANSGWGGCFIAVLTSGLGLESRL